MSNVTQRKVEALKYETGGKVRLTDKQYLVYHYLISIFKRNPDGEYHCYVYKNSFFSERCV